MTMTHDPLAIPAAARARLDQMDAARMQRISVLHAAAREQHDRRCSAARQDFMHGKTTLPAYRGAIQASEAQLAEVLANVPPAPNIDLMHARVEARMLECVTGWWAEELDAWTPATAGLTEGATHGAS